MNVGSHIGQYRILRKIGAGGMGTVFLGEHVLLGRQAAIKTLLPALSVQKEIVERFFNEARATSAISDPGVVQVFDFGYHVDGTAYIVMELLEGEALADRLDRLGKLPPAEALRITRQVACSLAAAHECSIVHRDLKPENVFLIHDAEAMGGERTKILDFGICKLGGENATLTGTMLGTPVYMSPEQCQGAGKVDHRSDIYALGCVLFQMLTGRPPFEGDGAGEFIVAHMQKPAPAPSRYVPELPQPVDALLQRCLAKSPSDRFQDMKELAAECEHVLAQLSAPGSVPHPVPSAGLALGAGFRSVYDGNFGSQLATHGPRARRPSTLNSLTGELIPSRRRNVRAMFAIILFATIVTMIAVNIRRSDEAIAMPTADEVAPVPAAKPMPEPPKPAPLVVEKPTPAAEPEVKPEVEAKPPIEKRAEPRATPKRTTPKPKTPEDLYETR